jgi:hypothetical protein
MAESDCSCPRIVISTVCCTNFFIVVLSMLGNKPMSV